MMLGLEQKEICQARVVQVHLPAPADNATKLLMGHLCSGTLLPMSQPPSENWPLSALALLPGIPSSKPLHTVFRDGLFSGAFT